MMFSGCEAYKQNILFRTGEEFNNTAFEKELATAERNYTLQRFDRITVEEIQELALALFHSDQLALTLLGPVDEREAYEKRLTL